jgi:hypothetical protein
MQVIEKLAENETFILTLCQHPSHPTTNLYHFYLYPVKTTNQTQLDTLSESIAMICDNKSGVKSSIILNCLEFKSVSLIKKLWKLSFQRAMAIENSGLDKFVVLSKSKIFKSFTKPIIKMKKASSYTKILSSIQDALNFV